MLSYRPIQYILEKYLKKVMRLKERYYLIKRLADLIEEMNKDLDFVIVEGKKDKKVLSILGFKKKIILVNSKILPNGKFTILTDFDREGKRFEKILIKKYGEKNFVKIYRKKFYELLEEYKIKEIGDLENSIKKVSNLF
ncbi:MAG: hypothetical protein QXI09_02730 [Candidatus Aenigmatarchaeota archaeon]